MDKVISIYGEFEEGRDPADFEQSIRDSAIWLANNGYRSIAVDLLEELAIAISLDVLLNAPKSSAQAKRDGDWDKVCAELVAIARTVRELPYSWRDPVIDEFCRIVRKGREDA